MCSRPSLSKSFPGRHSPQSWQSCSEARGEIGEIEDDRLRAEVLREAHHQQLLSIRRRRGKSVAEHSIRAEDRRVVPVDVAGEPFGCGVVAAKKNSMIRKHHRIVAGEDRRAIAVETNLANHVY